MVAIDCPVCGGTGVFRVVGLNDPPDTRLNLVICRCRVGRELRGHGWDEAVNAAVDVYGANPDYVRFAERFDD